MISKSRIKLISSLSHKKYRDETGLFVAEGTKLVLDLLSAFQSVDLFASSQWLSQNNDRVGKVDFEEVTEDDLSRMSNQKSPQGVLAVFRKPDVNQVIPDLSKILSLALDEVQDPGNLGTIIRIADWFGIENIFCSENCADAFSPKTVQATMGALARVKIHYVNLSAFLNQISVETPIYGTFMDGKNIYTESLTPNGIVVMGNEGNGISDDIASKVTRKLLIPNYPAGNLTSESLNVAVATALVCSEFRRRS